MKVAFATNDRKTIAQRTGRAKEFAVYELSAHAVINIEYHENNHEHNDHSHGEEHEHGHGHKEITDKLLDVDYLYVKMMGKHLKADIESAKIKYEKTEEDNIMEVIKDFFDEEGE